MTIFLPVLPVSLVWPRLAPSSWLPGHCWGSQDTPRALPSPASPGVQGRPRPPWDLSVPAGRVTAVRWGQPCGGDGGSDGCRQSMAVHGSGHLAGARGGRASLRHHCPRDPRCESACLLHTKDRKEGKTRAVCSKHGDCLAPQPSRSLQPLARRTELTACSLRPRPPCLHAALSGAGGWWSAGIAALGLSPWRFLAPVASLCGRQAKATLLHKPKRGASISGGRKIMLGQKILLIAAVQIQLKNKTKQKPKPKLKPKHKTIIGNMKNKPLPS